ncbi:unnamed protein product [Penicillium manginii]
MEELPEPVSNQFVLNTLLLYQGPQVTIKIGSHHREYVIFKDLLCSESAYFSAMFNGPFIEGQQQAANLKEGDGLSVHTFEAFIQWLYAGKIQFNVNDCSEKILSAIELARVGVMWDVPKLRAPIALYIKEVILSGPYKIYNHDYDCNIQFIGCKHIAAACFLPSKHPVREILAEASVESFILARSFKLLEAAERNPEFAADLIQKIYGPCVSILDWIREHCECENNKTIFEDPFTGSVWPPSNEDDL